MIKNFNCNVLIISILRKKFKNNCKNILWIQKLCLTLQRLKDKTVILQCMRDPTYNAE